MKKSLMTLAISIVLALIMPLSVWANFLDLLIDPATLHSDTKAESFNYDRNIRNNPVIFDSGNFCVPSTHASANLGTRNLSDIIWSHIGLPSGTFISADDKGESETKIYFTPFTDFAMVKNVLEPGTMLLFGICVLSLGLFAIKLRK